MQKRSYIVAATVLVLTGILVADHDTAVAQWWFNSWVECAAEEPVTLLTMPDGSGAPVTAARSFGGEITDATITLHLRDDIDNPVYDFPAEDMWLECACCDDWAVCPGGSIADGHTDAEGVTNWAQPLLAGGLCYNDGEPALVVYVMGTRIAGQDLVVNANSVDINGDLIVDLTDVVYLVQDYFGDYHFRSDLVWDGVLNLSDISAFALYYDVATCP